MKGITSSPILLFFAVAGTAVTVAAFLRGNHLFGIQVGFVYAAIAVALLWLLARSRAPDGRFSMVRAGLVVALCVPIGYAMAFPASLNSDVQVFIDKQATERRARAELAEVFASDPAYRDLSVSSVQMKVVNITVRGQMDARSDLDRLRSRIAAQCPAMKECNLHWDVTLRDTRQRVDGSDRNLFPAAEEK